MSEDELASTYAVPHDHTRWGDHILRVSATIAAGLGMLGEETIESAADLSCGSGAILDAMPARRKYYGDMAPGYFHGPIEQTIHLIPDVDLFVCTETIEHLDDPDAVLNAVRPKARMLILSTPVGAFDDGNVEHYWAWDSQAVEDMLTAAGFKSWDYTALRVSYEFGIWCAR